MDEDSRGRQPARGWPLVPRDASQALRVRRFFMAAASALLLPLTVAAGAVLGMVEARVAAEAGLLVLALIALFYALLRSGFNLRFRDPSLTVAQIGAAIACTAYVVHQAGAISSALALFYLMALMFGVLRLAARRLLALALAALAAHAIALWGWHARHPGEDTTASLMEIVVLAFALPWFAAMGGYVSRLRHTVAEANRRLQQALGRLEAMAAHDDLTGLYNRRFLMEFLEREAARARRSGSSYSLCVCDLDHFKRINDTLGHAAGDAALRHFALVAADAGLRTVDVFGRLGGEEFLIVLPDTDLAGARACAERVRAALAAQPVPGLPPDQCLTVTIGVVRAAPGDTPRETLARADRALYAAKAQGRDRVMAVA